MTPTKKKALRPAGRDPTRTISLRKRFAADAVRRLNALNAAIRVSVVQNDCFALREGDGPEPIFNQETRLSVNAPTDLERYLNRTFDLPPLPNRAYVGKRDAEKVGEFMLWLRNMQEASILETQLVPGLGLGTPVPWSDVYIQSAYQKGMAQAVTDINARGPSIPFGGTPEFLEASFLSPLHADRAGLMYTRTFDQLKGVTETMSQQMSQVLTKGMVEGRNPNEIARSLTGRVNAIGKTRAKLIARTEVIYAHSTAALNTYTQAEAFLGQQIWVEWFTALDERVRTKSAPDQAGRIGHVARHGVIYTQEEALQLLGEPNCRCAPLPSFDGPPEPPA